MALLAAPASTRSRGIVERNSGRLDEYGGMTPQEMYRLIERTPERAAIRWWATTLRAARWAWLRAADAHAGAPLLAVSVTAIIDRMRSAAPARDRRLIKTELARLAAAPSVLSRRCA